jgi:predicted methyltransferase
VTGEVEVEGTEKFVQIYFSKLQQLMSGDAERTRKRRGRRKAAPKRTVAKKTRKAAAKKAGEPKAGKESAIANVVNVIQRSTEGLSTKELKEKTKLNSRQVWAAIYRALKLGKIQKAKRGLYMKV